MAETFVDAKLEWLKKDETQTHCKQRNADHVKNEQLLYGAGLGRNNICMMWRTGFIAAHTGRTALLLF